MEARTDRFAPRTTRLLAAVAAVVALVLIAGCGGSSSKSSGGGGGPGTVKAAEISGYGRGLVTSAGKSVYVLSTDPPDGSRCAGTCAKAWVPLTVAGSAAAGDGADSSKLSTFRRKDGTTQVAYDKHALYVDSAAGATSGEGQAADGGIWYLIAPSGSPIKHSKAGNY